MFGWRESEREISIELEYCTLGNMLSVMDELAGDHNKLQSFWTQCALGIQCLHQTEIIHRDIKPENILVQRNEDSTYCWKLADFGLSNGFKRAETTCGTPVWAAPEQFIAGAYQSSSIDIYSFGMVLLATFGLFQQFDVKMDRTPVRLAVAMMLESLTRRSQYGQFVKKMLQSSSRSRPSVEECVKYIQSVDTQNGPPIRREPRKFHGPTRPGQQMRPTPWKPALQQIPFRREPNQQTPGRLRPALRRHIPQKLARLGPSTPFQQQFLSVSRKPGLFQQQQSRSCQKPRNPLGPETHKARVTKRTIPVKRDIDEYRLPPMPGAWISTILDEVSTSNTGF